MPPWWPWLLMIKIHSIIHHLVPNLEENCIDLTKMIAYLYSSYNNDGLVHMPIIHVSPLKLTCDTYYEHSRHKYNATVLNHFTWQKVNWRDNMYQLSWVIQGRRIFCYVWNTPWGLHFKDWHNFQYTLVACFVYPGVCTKFSGRLSEESFPWLMQKFPCILIYTFYIHSFQSTKCVTLYKIYVRYWYP